MAHVRIALERDGDGYPPFDTEEVRAEKVGANRYRLVSAPAFAPALAAGDVVATEEFEGAAWVTEVVDESDHWLARVIPLGETAFEHVVDVFCSMGCTASDTGFGLVTVDAGPRVDADHVLTELRAGFDEGEWDYEVPVAPRHD